MGVTFSTGAGFGHAPEHLAEAFSRLAAGSLRLTIGRIYPLEQAAAAHDDLEQARVTGKVLLQP